MNIYVFKTSIKKEFSLKAILDTRVELVV